VAEALERFSVTRAKCKGEYCFCFFLLNSRSLIPTRKLSRLHSVINPASTLVTVTSGRRGHKSSLLPFHLPSTPECTEPLSSTATRCISSGFIPSATVVVRWKTAAFRLPDLSAAPGWSPAESPLPQPQPQPQPTVAAFFVENCRSPRNIPPFPEAPSSLTTACCSPGRESPSKRHIARQATSAKVRFLVTLVLTRARLADSGGEW